MLQWIDNFEGYDPLNTTLSATANLAKNYNFFGTGNTSGSAQHINYQQSTIRTETRGCLGGPAWDATTPATTCVLTHPLGSAWVNGSATYLGFTYNTSQGTDATSGTFGLAHVLSGAYQGLLLKIGFNGNIMNLAWMAGGVVNSTNVTLPQALAAENFIELSFSPTATVLGGLSIWVNNRVVYSNAILPFGYSGDEVHWVIMGTLSNSAVGTSGTYVSAGLPVPTSASQGVVTDLYVVDATPGLNINRTGRIRVTSRVPSTDATPNDWTPYAGATEPTHAAIVAGNGDPSKYLESSTTAQSELYTSASFTSLSTEPIVGMMTRILASKDDASGADVAPVVKSGATSSSIPATLLTTAPSYVNNVLETDPATTTRWTTAGANGSEFGYTSEVAP